MTQDLSGSWCIKGTDDSTLIMDSTVPLMHHDPDRSWITDLDPDHPKGTLPIGTQDLRSLSTYSLIYSYMHANQFNPFPMFNVFIWAVALHPFQDTFDTFLVLLFSV